MAIALGGLDTGVTEKILDGELFRAACALWLHGSPGHLAGNMLFLWVFGDNIEDSMGHLRFILFYLLCGLAAGLTHSLMEPSSQMPSI